MLSYSLYNSSIATWCIQKGVNLVYMVDQTNKFQIMFQLRWQYFYFDQQSEKILQTFQKLELLKLFVDWSITDASYFLKHLLDWAWWLMIQSD